MRPILCAALLLSVSVAHAQSTSRRPPVPESEVTVLSVIYGAEHADPSADMGRLRAPTSDTMMIRFRCTGPGQDGRLRCERWNYGIIERRDRSCLVTAPLPDIDAHGAPSVFTWSGTAWSASEVILGGDWLETRMLIPSQQGWQYREAWQPVDGVCNDDHFRCERRERTYEPAEPEGDGILASLYVAAPACEFISFHWFLPPSTDRGGGRRRRTPLER